MKALVPMAPLPGKAIELSFSTSPKTLSLRFDSAPMYREAELWASLKQGQTASEGCLLLPDEACPADHPILQMGTQRDSERLMASHLAELGCTAVSCLLQSPALHHDPGLPQSRFIREGLFSAITLSCSASPPTWMNEGLHQNRRS